MPSSAIELKLQMARAMDVIVSEEALTVELEDARTVSVPLGWYPRLLFATPEERNNWCLIGKGSGIHWPDLDEDISIEGLLIGNPSGETERSFERWQEWREAQSKRKEKVEVGEGELTSGR